MSSNGVFQLHKKELNIYCRRTSFRCGFCTENDVLDILSFPHPRVKQLAELEKRNQGLRGHAKAVELAKLMAEELWKANKNNRVTTLAAAARRFKEKTADMTEEEAKQVKAVYTRCPLTWTLPTVCLPLPSSVS